MSTIETIIRQVNGELAPQFEERLRAHLVEQDKDWLIEQIIRLTLDPHVVSQRDQQAAQQADAHARAARVERVRAMALDEAGLVLFVARWQPVGRDELLADGLLLPGAPEPGTALIGPEHRSAQGEALLTQAKDTLFALLFGDGSTATSLARQQRELLTMTLPAAKAHALGFMKATTEIDVEGTWQDPESVSNDARADNVVLEVEFGETADEQVGEGIVVALALINDLEVNEQILYARMENIEQSTLG